MASFLVSGQPHPPRSGALERFWSSTAVILNFDDAGQTMRDRRCGTRRCGTDEITPICAVVSVHWGLFRPASPAHPVQHIAGLLLFLVETGINVKPQDIVANIGNANWETSPDRTAMDDVVIESGRDDVVAITEFLSLHAEAFG
jgi:hypothetical protein